MECGGMASNAMFAAQRLGARSGFIGSFGSDHLGLLKQQFLPVWKSNPLWDRRLDFQNCVNTHYLAWFLCYRWRPLQRVVEDR